MSDEWLPNAVLGGVSEAKVKAMFAKKKPGRMVNVVCAECQTRLGIVDDTPEGPFLTLRAPTHFAPDHGVGVHFAIAGGALPADDVAVTFHCMRHGHATATGAEFRAKVEEFRDRGRPSNLPVFASRSSASA